MSCRSLDSLYAVSLSLDKASGKEKAALEAGAVNVEYQRPWHILYILAD